MVRWHRTVKITSGKVAEAREWANEITEFLNKKTSQTSFQVFREEFGAPTALHWYADFENLAVLEQEMSKVQSDVEYFALIKKGADAIIPGTGKDTLVRSL
jgi:hypothetical protein